MPRIADWGGLRIGVKTSTPYAPRLVIVAAAASYIVDLVAAFLAPDVAKSIHGFATILPAIAEPAMVLYLLVIGVWIRKPSTERLLTAA